MRHYFCESRQAAAFPSAYQPEIRPSFTFFNPQYSLDLVLVIAVVAFDMQIIGTKDVFFKTTKK